MKIFQVNNQSILVIGTKSRYLQILVDILGQEYKLFHCKTFIRAMREIEWLAPDSIIIELNKSDFNNYITCQQIKNS